MDEFLQEGAMKSLAILALLLASAAWGVDLSTHALKAIKLVRQEKDAVKIVAAEYIRCECSAGRNDDVARVRRSGNPGGLQDHYQRRERDDVRHHVGNHREVDKCAELLR